MKATRDKHKPAADSCLAYAVALQDHFSRTLQLPGAKKLPSLLPGSTPTLAQRVGLIPRPDKLLTQEEWQQIHGLARQRNDALNACAICLETFNAEQQVLLSCSHVFHTRCLASFESHVRVKACPLCRKQWYQKRTISDAAEAYRHLSATRIQAAVRGWLCRKRLEQQLSQHPQPPQAAHLRRQWAAGRLQATGQALAGLVKGAADDLENLFAELDANLAASRQLAEPAQARLQASSAAAATAAGTVGTGDGCAEEQLQQVALQEQQEQHAAARPHEQRNRHQGCQQTARHSSDRQPTNSVQDNSTRDSRSVTSGPSSMSSRELLSSQTSQPAQQAAGQSSRSQNGRGAAARGAAAAASAAAVARAAQSSGPTNTSQSSAARHAAEADAPAAVCWEEVVSRACQRGETECAICLGPLTARREAQGVALLSCSHIFHVQCVSSFEQFEQGRGGQPSCPVCRCVQYSRRCFDVHEV